MNQPGNCPRCGATGSGRFCAQCGAALSQNPSQPRERRAWAAAGVGAIAVLGLLITVVVRERGSAPPPLAAEELAATDAAPPDLSSMTPRERFDRLYQRVMGAAQTGDTLTAARFTPMVFAAYEQLDTVDSDARYHAALLHLHLRGDTAAALRLADSILGANPRHLFGFLIRGTAAQLAANTPLQRRAQDGFLAAYQLEMQANRPEYRDHQRMLEQFHTRAREDLATRTTKP